jgi:hypothetical protein
VRAEETTWYVARVSSGDAPLRVEHFWSKGPKLRAETVLAGRPLLTIVSGDRYFVIDTLAGSGIGIRRSPEALEAAKHRERPFGNEAAELLGAGAEKVGSDEVLGRPCDVYRLTNRRGRREACISQDELRLPMHFLEFDRASGRTGQARYLDWARGFPAPDSFFEPDPRFEIERIEYEDYLRRATQEKMGPAPVLYKQLLHGG